MCFYFLPTHAPTCGGGRAGRVPTLVVPLHHSWRAVTRQPSAEILSDYGSLWLALLVAATVRFTAVTSIDGKEGSKPGGEYGGSRTGHGERCVSHELVPREVCLPEFLFACCLW